MNKETIRKTAQSQRSPLHTSATQSSLTSTHQSYAKSCTNSPTNTFLTCLFTSNKSSFYSATPHNKFLTIKFLPHSHTSNLSICLKTHFLTFSPSTIFRIKITTGFNFPNVCIVCSNWSFKSLESIKKSFIALLPIPLSHIKLNPKNHHSIASHAKFLLNTENKVKSTENSHHLPTTKTIPKQTKLMPTAMIAKKKQTFGSAWFAVVLDAVGTRMQTHTNIL
jgi:hypothetical protein